MENSLPLTSRPALTQTPRTARVTRRQRTGLTMGAATTWSTLFGGGHNAHLLERYQLTTVTVRIAQFKLLIIPSLPLHTSLMQFCWYYCENMSLF